MAIKIVMKSVLLSFLLSSVVFSLLSGRAVGVNVVFDPLVCFVVRTYWGHGSQYGDGSLGAFLSSLQSQKETRWEALFVVVDNRPFPDLRKMVEDRNDSRFWVHAEWIKHGYAPKQDSQWSPGYHSRLYNATDQAVRACPRSTKWVVMTNGDNEYDPSFVRHVLSAPDTADVVAFDFYSRYQRPTASPCERFVRGDHLPNCKVNNFSFCQTDISANAFRRSKLINDNMFFGRVDPDSGIASDGIMASLMSAVGWTVHHAAPGRCLVDHGPSPQRCLALGGVWDDSVMDTAEFTGGLCVNNPSAQRKFMMYKGRYEFVKVLVAHDPESFVHRGDLSQPLDCLRVSNPVLWRQTAMFGRICASNLDLPSFPPELPISVWDNFTRLEAVAAKQYLATYGMGTSLSDLMQVIDGKTEGAVLTAERACDLTASGTCAHVDL